MTSRTDRLRELAARMGEIRNRDVAAALRVSPATAHRLLQALVLAGTLERHGKGRAAGYRLRTVRRRFRLAGLDEHVAIEALAREIAAIRPLAGPAAHTFAYAASEMLNNAIDHSGGRGAVVTIAFESGGATVVTIADDGIGVFRRVAEEFGYATPQEAIVQLETGKLTSDPARHSGEGLFFTSKAVSRFRLESQGVAWVVDNVVGDSGIGTSDVRRGTRVTFSLVPGHVPRLQDVFAAFTDAQSLAFLRTQATIRLAAFGKTLVARSEAKRLVARLPAFTHVRLDFTGVDVVGQGFCDEVFRVFAGAHPGVTLEPVGMNEAVAFMVARAQAARPPGSTR